MSDNQLRLNGEVQELMRELRAIASNAKRLTARTLTVATEPLIAELNVAAPIGTRVHKRYSTPKAARSIRAGRGKGVVVATYKPGNLAFSFQRFRFRGAKYSVQVGAKLAKGAAAGDFGGFGGRSDGYYLHMVEFGTRHMSARPFVRPTWAKMKEPVRALIVQRLQKQIKRIKKN